MVVTGDGFGGGISGGGAARRWWRRSLTHCDGTVGPGLVRELDSHLQCDDRPRKDGRARVMAAISGYLLSLPPPPPLLTTIYSSLTTTCIHKHPALSFTNNVIRRNWGEKLCFCRLISAPLVGREMSSCVVASGDNGCLRLTLTIGHLPRLLHPCPPTTLHNTSPNSF